MLALLGRQRPRLGGHQGGRRLDLAVGRLQEPTISRSVWSLPQPDGPAADKLPWSDPQTTRPPQAIQTLGQAAQIKPTPIRITPPSSRLRLGGRIARAVIGLLFIGGSI